MCRMLLLSCVECHLAALRGLTRMPLHASDSCLCVCCMHSQDDSVFKMIVDMASVDTGVGALALAQVIEDDADAEAADGTAGGRQRRASSRGKTHESPLATPRHRAAKRTKAGAKPSIVLSGC